MSEQKESVTPEVLEPELKLPEVPEIKLEVATTTVTDKAIAELKEKYKDLPEIKDAETLAINKTARNDIKSIRVMAGKYKDLLKSKLSTVSKKIGSDWEDLKVKLQEIEAPIIEKIKFEEDRLKIEKERKKKEREAINKAIDKALEVIKSTALRCVNMPTKGIMEAINILETSTIEKEDFGDRMDEAEMGKELAIETLNEMLEAKMKSEKAEADLKLREEALAKERAEVDRVAKEKEEALAKERAEAEEKARVDLEAFEKKKRDDADKLKAEREEFEKNKRLEDEKARAIIKELEQKQIDIDAAEKALQEKQRKLDDEKSAKEVEVENPKQETSLLPVTPQDYILVPPVKNVEVNAEQEVREMGDPLTNDLVIIDAVKDWVECQNRTGNYMDEIYDMMLRVCELASLHINQK